MVFVKKHFQILIQIYLEYFSNTNKLSLVQTDLSGELSIYM